MILNKAVELGLEFNPLRLVRSKRTKAKLHKPFTNLREVLEEVKAYNFNLYLCCLMTYGCLLRPHREIRELTWGDFSDDLSQINLSGDRNKSGKNRILPVPYYVQEELIKKIRSSTYLLGHLSHTQRTTVKGYGLSLRNVLRHLSQTKHFTLLGIQTL